MEKVFFRLCAIAKETLGKHPKTKMSQVVVLRTCGGNTHALFARWEEVFSVGDRIADILKAQEDTAVKYVVTMWENGCVDLPSYSLREKLILLDPQNRETLLFLQNGNLLHTRTMKSTM